MKNKLLIQFVVLFALLAIVSCSKDAVLGQDEDIAGDITLRVRTRAQGAGATDMTVATPVNIYVFDTSGKCVFYKSLSTATETADFKVASGAYHVCSVAGANGTDYILPKKETAALSSVVELNAGKKHGDIMTASGDVVVEDGVDTELALTMNRKVFMLRDVTISDVPEDVIAVSAEIRPLYENVALSGDYCGSNGEYAVELKKASGSKWSCMCNAYLMASVGNPVITFRFVMSDGKVRTFDYTGDKPFVANYKVDLAVSYHSVAEPTVKCIVDGVSWAGEQTWTIDINDKSMGESNGDDVKVDEAAPLVGTSYQGCYVLKSEQSPVSANMTTVTLLAPESKNSLAFTEGSEQSLKQSVDAATAELSVEGVGGWRLPTKAEMAYIMDNLAEVNSGLSSLHIEQIYKSSSGIYYFLDTDDTVKAMSTDKTEYTPKSGRASYRLRPVATVIFYKR